MVTINTDGNSKLTNGDALQQIDKCLIGLSFDASCYNSWVFWLPKQCFILQEKVNLLH